MRKIVTLGILGLLGLGIVGTAAADDADCPRVENGVIILCDQQVEGRRQVPVQFVMVRSDAGYRLVEQRTSFVREIVRTTGTGALR